MSKAAAYRRYAQECLQIATTASPEQRLLLIEMARTWHQLAQEPGQFDGTSSSRSENPEGSRECSTFQTDGLTPASRSNTARVQ